DPPNRRCDDAAGTASGSADVDSSCPPDVEGCNKGRDRRIGHSGAIRAQLGQAQGDRQGDVTNPDPGDAGSAPVGAAAVGAAAGQVGSQTLVGQPVGARDLRIGGSVQSGNRFGSSTGAGVAMPTNEQNVQAGT